MKVVIVFVVRDGLTRMKPKMAARSWGKPMHLLKAERQLRTPKRSVTVLPLELPLPKMFVDCVLRLHTSSW